MDKKFLFLLFMTTLIIQYGTWTGQIVTASRTDQEGNRNAVYLLGTVFIIFAIVLIAYKGKIKIFFPYKSLLLLFIINLFFISLIREDVYGSLRQFVSVLLTLIIVGFFATLLHSMGIISVLKLFSISIEATLIISVYVHVKYVATLSFFNHSPIDRLGGLFFYGELAFLLGVGCLTSFIVFSISPAWLDRTVYFLFFGTMLIGLLLTDTRSAIFGFIVSWIYIILFKKNTRLGFKVISMLFLLVSVVFSNFYFSSTTAGVDIVNSSSFRWEIWRVAIKGILADPIRGYGHNMIVVFRNLPTFIFTQQLYDPHSSFLSHMLNYGVVSFFVFFLYIGLIIKKLINEIPHEYKGIFSIPLFWVISASVGGSVFNIAGGIVPIYFLLTVMGILSHPNLFYNQRKRSVGIKNGAS